MDDDRQFVGIGRIIGNAIRDHGGLQMTVTILMLQALSS